jgi:hypothetical protein
MEASELVSKVDSILNSVTSRKKGLRWKTRSMIGERVKWYEEVETGEFELGENPSVSPQNSKPVTLCH